MSDFVLCCAFNLFVCLIWGTFTVHIITIINNGLEEPNIWNPYLNKDGTKLLILFSVYSPPTKIFINVSFPNVLLEKGLPVHNQNIRYFTRQNTIKMLLCALQFRAVQWSSLSNWNATNMLNGLPMLSFNNLKTFVTHYISTKDGFKGNNSLKLSLANSQLLVYHVGGIDFHAISISLLLCTLKGVPLLTSSLHDQ